MNEIIACINIVFIFCLIYFSLKKHQLEQSLFFWLAAFTKLLAGISLGLIYTHYYKFGDTFGYFRESLHIKKVFVTDFQQGIKLFFSFKGDESCIYYLQPRAFIFSKFVFVVNLFTNSSYYITSLYFSFVSFWASLYLYITLKQYLQEDLLIKIILFITPSIVFWSSGILKESIAYASFCCLIAFLLNKNSTFRSIIITTISFIVLAFTKYYIIALFIPLLVLYLIDRSKINLQFYQYLIVIIITLLISSFVHENLNLHHVILKIKENNEAIKRMSHPDGVIAVEINSDTLSLFWNIIKSLLIGLSGRLKFSNYNYLVNLSVIENYLILGLLIFQVYRKKWRLNFMFENRLLVYTLLAACILTLSTPNYGTLSRYRVFYLPFIFISLLNFNTSTDSKKLISFSKMQ